MRLSYLALLFTAPLMTEAAVITSGTITISPDFGGVGNFNFSGPGFSASGDFGATLGVDGVWDLEAARLVGTPPGGTVGVNGEASTDDFGGGSATVDGMTFNNVEWGTLVSSSVFNVVGGPPITLNAGPGTYQTTVTFSGRLCGGGTAFFPPTCGQVFLPDLTGSGIVTVNFAPYSNGNFAYTTATYTFAPKPGAWLLAGLGGLVVLVSAIAKKNKLVSPAPTSAT